MDFYVAGLWSLLCGLCEVDSPLPMLEEVCYGILILRLLALVTCY